MSKCTDIFHGVRWRIQSDVRRLSSWMADIYRCKGMLLGVQSHRGLVSGSWILLKTQLPSGFHHI